jgi:hypothetical protein
MDRPPTEQVNIEARQGKKISVFRILAVALIVLGALGLVYGSFSYTKEAHPLKLGPIDVSITHKETVNVPVWVGVGAIAVGGCFCSSVPRIDSSFAS